MNSARAIRYCMSIFLNYTIPCPFTHCLQSLSFVSFSILCSTYSLRLRLSRSFSYFPVLSFTFPIRLCVLLLFSLLFIFFAVARLLPPPHPPIQSRKLASFSSPTFFQLNFICPLLDMFPFTTAPTLPPFSRNNLRAIIFFVARVRTYGVPRPSGVIT